MAAVEESMNWAGINPVVVLGALIAVIIGVADLWFFGKLAHDSDILFIVGGISALGVHFVNGSANAILSAVEALNNHVSTSQVPPK